MDILLETAKDYININIEISRREHKFSIFYGNNNKVTYYRQYDNICDSDLDILMNKLADIVEIYKCVNLSLEVDLNLSVLVRPPIYMTHLKLLNNMGLNASFISNVVRLDIEYLHADYLDFISQNHSITEIFVSNIKSGNLTNFIEKVTKECNMLHRIGLKNNVEIVEQYDMYDKLEYTNYNLLIKHGK